MKQNGAALLLSLPSLLAVAAWVGARYDVHLIKYLTPTVCTVIFFTGVVVALASFLLFYRKTKSLPILFCLTINGLWLVIFGSIYFYSRLHPLTGN